MITSSAMHSHRMHHSRSPFTDGKRSKASHVNEFAYPIDPRQFYTIISVKNISPKLSDIDVEKLCYKKFSKYGSISVKLSSRGYDRVAFIHFTNHEDARKARHARSDLIWDNLPVILEPVFYHEPYTPELPPHHEPFRYERHHRLPSSSKHQRRNSPVHSSHQSRRTYAPYIPFPPDLFDYSQPKSSKRPRSPSSPSTHRIHTDYESNIQQEPTRTLSIENLPRDLTESKLQEIFGRFGIVQQIDLKKSSSKRLSATIRYENMNMAFEAHRAMDGQYISKSRCQVKYGKIVPSKYLWVGNIPLEMRKHHLEHAFAHYGQIKLFDFENGDPIAMITFVDANDAIKAREKLNGAQIYDGRILRNEVSRGLRIDFLDRPTSRRFVIVRSQQKFVNQHRSRSSSSSSNSSSPSHHSPSPSHQSETIKSERQSPSLIIPLPDSIKHRRSSERSSTSSLYDPTIPIAGRTFHPPIGSYLSSKETEEIRNLNDLMLLCEELNASATKSNTALSTVYPVQFLLKSDAYDARLHFLAGSPTLASILLGQPGDLVAAKTELKITQRLRLDEKKLDDLERKLRTSVLNALELMESSSHSTGFITRKQSGIINQTKFSLLIAVPKMPSKPIKSERTSPSLEIKQEKHDVDSENEADSVLSRLISYLIEKQAAGVISVPFYPTYADEQSPRQETAVLHIFPPCQFSKKLLQLISPSIQFSSTLTADEHLMLLIVHNE